MTSLTKIATCLLLLGSLVNIHAEEFVRLREELVKAIARAQNYTPGEVEVLSAFRAVDRELDVSRVLAEGRLRGGELGALEASLELQKAVSSQREALVQLAFTHEYDQIRSDATRLLEFVLADEPLQRQLIAIASEDKKFSNRLLAHRLLFERRLWNFEAKELLKLLASRADKRQMQTILSMVSNWGITNFNNEYLQILQEDWSKEDIDIFRKTGVSGSVPYHIAANAISHMGLGASDLLPALEARLEWFQETFVAGQRMPAVYSRLEHASKVARGIIPQYVEEALDGTGPLNVNTQYGPDWLQQRIERLRGQVDSVHRLAAHESAPEQKPASVGPADAKPAVGQKTPGPLSLPVLQMMIVAIIFGGSVIYILRRRSKRALGPGDMKS